MPVPKHEANRQQLANDIARLLADITPEAIGFTLAGLLGDPLIWAASWKAARPNRASAPSVETRMAAIEQLAAFGDDVPDWDALDATDNLTRDEREDQGMF